MVFRIKGLNIMSLIRMKRMRNNHSSLFLVQLFLLFFILGCNKNIKNDSELLPEISEITDEISNQTITSFAQDKYGYLWIGTKKGLNKYNGFEYHSYLSNKNPNSLINNFIICLLTTDDGNIWVGTSKGICYYTDEDNFKHIPIEKESLFINELFETNNGIIVARTGNYLEAYDAEKDSFSVVYQVKKDDVFLEFCIDNKGRIWEVSHNSLRFYDIDNNTKSELIEIDENIIDILMGSNGDLWLICENEIKIFDTNTETFVTDNVPDIKTFGEAEIKDVFQYTDNLILIYNELLELFLYDIQTGNVLSQEDPNFPFYVPDMIISTIFSDEYENLWIGSYYKGFQLIYNNKSEIKDEAFITSILNKKSIEEIQIDKENNLWFLTKDDGIYIKSGDSEIKQVQIKGLENAKNIKNLFIDSQNYIYVSHDFDIYKCRYRNGFLISEIKYSFPENYFVSLTEDVDGRIWVSNRSERIFLLDKNSSDYATLQIGPLGSNIYASDMISLSSGEIAAATFIHGISIINPQNLSVKHYSINELEDDSYIYFLPSVLYEDSSNLIWLGSHSEGLFIFDLTTKKFKKADVSCNYVKAIVEDEENCLWFTTDKGIIKYDRLSDKFISYQESDVIGLEKFNKKSAVRTNDNLMLFGRTDGITVLNPNELNYNRQITLLFEDLFVNNKLQYAYKDPCINKNINEVKTINLSNDDNYFSISYLALDYHNFSAVRYNYILEGFEDEWVDARNIRQAFYSNLPPGKYKFKIKALNDDYTEVLGENSIDVIVHPGFWNHPIMLYLLYPLLFITIVVLGFWQYLKIMQSRRQISQANMEKEQEKKLNMMNMRFFSNVSHEFRTPLTMIRGPIEMILDDKNINKEYQKLLIIVHRNITRLLRFVSQLMDISKIDSDNIRLNVRFFDIISVMNNLLEVFIINAKEKGISIQTHGLDNTYITWLDRDKFEKVLSNLVSNAMKFTNSGGVIDISLDIISREMASELFNPLKNSKVREYIKIVVKDTGKGIPEDQLESIFKRYYQVESDSTGQYNWGTGIGLYYSKYLVELHHGQIKASNVNNGTGAEFSFIIPIDENVYSEDKQIVNEPKQELSFITDKKIVDYEINETDLISNENKPTILVVEDDIEVAHFLKTLLSPVYKVETRFDAQSAFEVIEKINPDLIISDVVMPGEMDGNKLCEKIKNDLATCHIPVILLTAKGNVEHQVEGLNYGADAYVVKPFAPSYLFALIKSQFANRERLRKILPHITQTDTLEKDSLSHHDKLFMDNLFEIMEQELSNSELNINKIVDILSISRTNLYYKIKSITGENPNTFFRAYKLNRAAQFLETGKFNISEAADETGFSTLSHFSVSFKKHFGVSPSEYILKKK